MLQEAITVMKAADSSAPADPDTNAKISSPIQPASIATPRITSLLNYAPIPLKDCLSYQKNEPGMGSEA